MVAKQVIVLNYQEKLKSHHTYKYQKVIKQNIILYAKQAMLSYIQNISASAQRKMTLNNMEQADALGILTCI